MAKIDFEARLGEGSAKLLAQLESALGAKGRSAILELIKSDPAARRLAEKIVGASSPAAIKEALKPKAAQASSAPGSSQKAKVQF